MYMYFKLHTYNDNAYSPCIRFLLLAVTKHAGQRHLSERLSLPQLRGYKEVRGDSSKNSSRNHSAPPPTDSWLTHA